MFRPEINCKRLRFFVFIPLFLLVFSACGSAQVLGLSLVEGSELLNKGDTGFISQAQLPSNFSESISSLKQLEHIHPAAAFYSGLLVGEEKNGDLETTLFCAALESPSLPARREAARKLLPLILNASGTLLQHEKNVSPEKVKDILDFLDSRNIARKNEAASVTLRAACLYRLGRYEETSKLLQGPLAAANANLTQSGTDPEFFTVEWNTALYLFAGWKRSGDESFRSEIPAFLFKNVPELSQGSSAEANSGARRLQSEIRLWAFREMFSPGAPSAAALLSAEESAVLSGKLVSASYQTILLTLRPALLDGGIVFFRHPDLIVDLGRAYQYTPIRHKEGADLFRAWSALLAPDATGFTMPVSIAETDDFKDYRELEAYINTLDSDAVNARGFLILFYLGRIERAMGNYAASSDSFNRARDVAPNELQSDACIWYTLMNAYNKDPASTMPLVLATMPLWNDVSYFSDILDRLSSYLTGRRRWTDLAEIFSHLENKIARGSSHSGESLAQYAWILGRAAQEGYIQTNRSAEDFFRIAFEQGQGSYYYRAMAASKLKNNFAPAGETKKAGTRSGQDEETEFLLGFYKCGAASLALPYIYEREEALSLADKRKIAETLASSNRWKESLDFVYHYGRRPDYTINRQDLLLFYPRPFQELIEKYASEMELGAEIVYGLIRTESYFMSEIVSRSGAVGLAQIMENTAGEMAGRIARRGGADYRNPDGINLKDAETNIHIGAYYLRYLTEQMGNPMLALLAYNGGMGRMRRWLAADRQQRGGGLPHDLFLETIEYAETREYGRRVLAAAAVYGYLYYGMTMEEVAEDIYRH